MTEEELKQSLQEERKKRSEACTTELQALMDKHNCTLDVVTILRSGQSPLVQIEVVAK